MSADLPGAAVLNARDAASRSAWRHDPLLWVALASTFAVKIVVFWLQTDVFRRSGWLQPAFADLRALGPFLRAVAAGGTPYVDVPVDAPVLAAGFYGLLAKLHASVPLDLPRPFLHWHAGLMLGVDVLNAALLYTAVREHERRSALRAALVLSCSLSFCLLGPTHIDGWIVSCVLLAYRFRDRPRIAAALWSIATGLHGVFALVFVALEVQRFQISGDRGRWRQSVPVFAGVLLLLHAPLWIAAWTSGSQAQAWEAVFAWQGHTPGPFTALGLIELWIGRTPLHAWALPMVAVLGAWAWLRIRRAELPETIIVLAIALMTFHPRANIGWQLWLYPLLILIAVRAPQGPRSFVLALYGALDLATALGSSVLLARMKTELGSFDAGAAAERGAAWTLLFSIAAALRLVLLAVLVRSLVRGAVPAAAIPAPLGWPKLEPARWLAWVHHPALPSWLAWAFIVGQTLLVAPTMWSSPEYSDEVSHVPQIESFCRGDGALDERITMLPGYHITTALVATLRGDCGLAQLRQVNLVWALAATFLAFLILRSLAARSAPTRTIGFHFLPMLLPYYYFVYTDVLAVVLVLLAVYLMLNRYFAVAGLVGAVGIMVRQTNVLVLAIIALVAFAEEPEAKSVWRWLRSLSAKTWSCALGLAGFLVFVVKNEGVAMGDRQSHEAGLHVGNVILVLFLVAVCALPVNLERIWRARERLLTGAFAVALAALYLVYVYLFEVEHEYNRHEFFLRNVVLLWATTNALTKTLFFVPVALGLAALWVTPLARRSLWMAIAVLAVGLLPEALIEQRYGIVPVGLWMLLRRDGSRFAEALTAAMNVAIGTFILDALAAGKFAL